MVSHSSILARRTPWTVRKCKKKKKKITSEHVLHRSEGVQYATVEEWRANTNTSRENEAAGQSGKDAQLWTCLVVKVKSNAVKNNIAYKPGILCP